MNPASPVPPQTQASQLGFQSLTSASEALYPSNSYFQDYQAHRDPNLLSPYSGTRSRASSQSSVGPYTCDYPIQGLPIMSIKSDHEGSSAAFSDAQRYSSNEPPMSMDTEDDEDDEGTPTPGARHLAADKAIGGKNFPHKLYNVVNESGMWSDDGLSFSITNPTEFSRVLTENKTFKQSSFQSFIRQLNMYDFTKVNRAPRAARGSVELQIFQFRHNKGLFQRGRPDLVKLISRKSTETPGRKDGFQVGLSHDASSATSTGELKPQEGVYPSAHEHQCSSHQLVLDLQQKVERLEDQLSKLIALVTNPVTRVEVPSEFALGSHRFQPIEPQSTGSSVPRHAENQANQTAPYNNAPVNYGVPTSTNQTSSQTFQNYATSGLGSDSFAQHTPNTGQQYRLEMAMGSASTSQQSDMSSTPYGSVSTPQPQAPLLMTGSEQHYPGQNMSPTGPPSPQHLLSHQTQHASPLSPRIGAKSPPLGRAGGRNYAAAVVPVAEPPPQGGFNLFRGGNP